MLLSKFIAVSLVALVTLVALDVSMFRFSCSTEASQQFGARPVPSIEAY
jgi:hypothetical protein